MFLRAKRKRKSWPQHFWVFTLPVISTEGEQLQVKTTPYIKCIFKKKPKASSSPKESEWHSNVPHACQTFLLTCLLLKAAEPNISDFAILRIYLSPRVELILSLLLELNSVCWLQQDSMYSISAQPHSKQHPGRSSWCCAQGFHSTAHIEISKRVDKSLGTVLILWPGKKKDNHCSESIRLSFSDVTLWTAIGRKQNILEPDPLESQLPAKPRRLRPCGPAVTLPSVVGHPIRGAADLLLSIWQVCFTMSLILPVFLRWFTVIASHVTLT